MQINADIIKKLNPCKDRFDNFINNYPNFNGSLKQFINLKKISFNDKIWVISKLFTKKQNVKWSILCAESVLHNFEKKHPKDKRPRHAIDATKKWLNNPSKSAKSAAWSAANSAAWSATRSAWSASYAAESAARSAWSASYAAESANSAAWSAARFAAESAARFAKKKQETIILNLMLQCI